MRRATSRLVTGGKLRIRICSRSALAAAAVVVTAGMTYADPLPNEQLKFDNEPMLATPIGANGAVYNGHDEISTAYLSPTAAGVYSGSAMADDFSDKFATPVFHVTWWGSYLKQLATGAAGAQRFLISFESDVPQGSSGANFSHPGAPLLSEVVSLGALAPGSGTFTETSTGITSTDGAIYKYNSELAVPFPEQPDTVYWLKIVALDETPSSTAPNSFIWGWHNRDYTLTDPLAATAPAVSPGETNQGNAAFPVWHFQDDAVTSAITAVVPTSIGPVPAPDETNFEPTTYVDNVDGPTGISSYSKDLAFQLYTVVPEPTSMAVVTVMAGGLVLRRRNGPVR